MNQKKLFIKAVIVVAGINLFSQQIHACQSSAVSRGTQQRAQAVIRERETALLQAALIESMQDQQQRDAETIQRECEYSSSFNRAVMNSQNDQDRIAWERASFSVAQVLSLDQYYRERRYREGEELRLAMENSRRENRAPVGDNNDPSSSSESSSSSSSSSGSNSTSNPSRSTESNVDWERVLEVAAEEAIVIGGTAYFNQLGQDEKALIRAAARRGRFEPSINPNNFSDAAKDLLSLVGWVVFNGLSQPSQRIILRIVR